MTKHEAMTWTQHRCVQLGLPAIVIVSVESTPEHLLIVFCRSVSFSSTPEHLLTVVCGSVSFSSLLSPSNKSNERDGHVWFGFTLIT